MGFFLNMSLPEDSSRIRAFRPLRMIRPTPSFTSAASRRRSFRRAEAKKLQRFSRQIKLFPGHFLPMSPFQPGSKNASREIPYPSFSAGSKWDLRRRISLLREEITTSCLKIRPALFGFFSSTTGKVPQPLRIDSMPAADDLPDLHHGNPLVSHLLSPVSVRKEPSLSRREEIHSFAMKPVKNPPLGGNPCLPPIRTIWGIQIALSPFPWGIVVALNMSSGEAPCL